MKLNLIVPLIAALSFSQLAQSQPDYEIYSKILSDFKAKILVIKQETRGFEFNPDFKNLKKHFETLDKETFDDFAMKLFTEDTLSNNFITGKKIVFINSEKIRELFSSVTSDGWENFYKEFGKAQGVTTFSRVGYNKSKTQALVYNGTQSKWLVGAGYYDLFEFRHGKWIQISSYRAWVS
jgi:hypothetical protein